MLTGQEYRGTFSGIVTDPQGAAVPKATVVATETRTGVKSTKREMLNCEIEEGAASTVLVHLANISYRLGRTIHFNRTKLTCVNDAEANKLATRVYRKPYVVPEKV